MGSDIQVCRSGHAELFWSCYNLFMHCMKTTAKWLIFLGLWAGWSKIIATVNNFSHFLKWKTGVRKFGFTCPGVRFSWQAAAAGVFMALFFRPNPERYIRVFNEFLSLFWNISWRLVAGCWSNVCSAALPWSLSQGRERRAQTLTGREQCSRLLERLKPSVTCSLWHSHELNSGDATNGPRVCLCSFRHRFNWLLFKPPPSPPVSFCYSRPLYEQWGYHGDSLVTHKTVSTTARTHSV